MKTIYINDLDEIFNKEDLALMLGSFDGMHLGHLKLLEELNKINLKKGLLTFYPHPLSILKNEEFSYLDLVRDKEEFLKEKLDYLIVLKTSTDLLQSSKDLFINFLKINNVKSVVCGKDYTFGSFAKGSIKDLTIFDLHIVPDFKIDDTRVSSTLIRQFLNNGDVDLASKFLGRNYFIRGLVSKGSQLGRTIGFPTANVENTDYLLPKNGVYFGYVYIENNKYKGMINIGINPTINLLNKRRLEVHILDFNQDIYNKEIKVEIVKKIRDETKFNSKDELIEMLKKNKEECKSLN